MLLGVSQIFSNKLSAAEENLNNALKQWEKQGLEMEVMDNISVFSFFSVFSVFSFFMFSSSLQLVHTVLLMILSFIVA